MKYKEELKDLIKDFPKLPGVYLMKNKHGKIIYVGKAKALRDRVRSYFNESSLKASTKTRHLVGHIDFIDYILTKTEVEAFLLEASLIKKHRPKYNIRLKDDKSYPYISCNISHDYPRFYFTRKVLPGSEDIYFGPYSNSYAVRSSIKFVNRTFKIRDCTEKYMRSRKRPCMTFEIGRCTAPCVDYVTPSEYGKDVDQALEFLRGEDEKVKKHLSEKMYDASQNERYEAAGRYRDSLEAMKAIWQRQTVIDPKQIKDQDVIACFGDESGTMVNSLHVRRGRVIGNRHQFLPGVVLDDEMEDPREWLTSFINQYYAENIVPDQIIIPFDLGADIYKLLEHVFLERNNKSPQFLHAHDKSMQQLMVLAKTNAEEHFKNYISKRNRRLTGLEEIQSKLKLPNLPKRMECYDISHFQGKDTVASQVVFEEGLPKGDDYRRYKIKTVDGNDDFASMKEVLTRRFNTKRKSTAAPQEEPDLLVVDGGKGQLGVAFEVLKELNLLHIPVVGMAKARALGEFHDSEVKASQERFFLPGRQNPVTFRNSSEALKILVGLRDEAHRFAITFHRKLRSQTSMHSQLDEISGLGERRKKALLKKFKDIESIKLASAEDIEKMPTFHRVLAERILLHLNDDTEK